MLKNATIRRYLREETTLITPKFHSLWEWGGRYRGKDPANTMEQSWVENHLSGLLWQERK